jgi:methylphosphotriester-DNA--protein-cysteine methyltransferase
MIRHNAVNTIQLHQQIRRKTISFAGNEKLNIYGTLHCSSGKRMKKANRVFFISEQEAIQSGYRPCGHCKRAAYKKWKDGLI